LMMEDLNASFLAAFLDHIENTRANGARSRNLRLTAIRSFFRYAALESPQHSGLIQRVLAIPNKRQSRPLVDFLSRPEINALLAAPNLQTWVGGRNHTLLLTAVQTGLRLTEITSILQQDVSLASGAHVRCEGKGRKERCTPLTKSTVTALTAWIREQGVDRTRILFPTARGGRLSADAVQYLVAKHDRSARLLQGCRVAPLCPATLFFTAAQPQDVCLYKGRGMADFIAYYRESTDGESGLGIVAGKFTTPHGASGPWAFAKRRRIQVQAPTPPRIKLFSS